MNISISKVSTQIGLIIDLEITDKTKQSICYLDGLKVKTKKKAERLLQVLYIIQRYKNKKMIL